MRTLFDQETIMEIERYNIRQESCQEGLREDRREGRQEEFAKGVHSMRRAGLDDARIASLLERDIADVEAIVQVEGNE